MNETAMGAFTNSGHARLVERARVIVVTAANAVRQLANDYISDLLRASRNGRFASRPIR
jgi:hypothetical protein